VKKLSLIAIVFLLLGVAGCDGNGVTADTTAPLISAISVTGITETSATVTWTTDEPSTSEVQYGVTDAYGSSSGPDTSLVTDHSITLSDLTPATTYHCRVLSKDAWDNQAVSGDHAFTTVDTTAPLISAFSVTGITETAATVTWTTDEPSTSEVQYGVTDAYGSSSGPDTSLVTDHSITLSDLTPDTSYHCRVLSKDAWDNQAVSGDHTFTTATPAPIVQTLYGAVKGSEDEAGTWVWKAIPFAKPPVGDLRWKAPQDPEPWDGVREEIEFCSACTQYDQLSGTSITGSEDCLYLNIWRPQSEETDLPVYVWIHGGGNSIGSATLDPGTYGANLASKSNMVFVSVNYRLGPFGWFTHPALRSGEPGDEADDSGNYGTLDLIQALRWIQDNIEAFGGDPDNVTITGESAGAMNVLSLMISPAAEGLFHKALAQSPATFSHPVETGEASAHDVLLKLLVNDGTAVDEAAAETHLDGMSNTDIEAYLRSKPAEELYACYEQIGWGLLAFPTIFQDGTVISATGLDTFPSGGHLNKVPIILGSNKEETKIFLFMDPAFQGKDELYQIVAAYSSDLWKANGVDDVARKLRSYPDQPGVYVYQFLWGAGGDTGESPIPDPWGFKLGAAHSLDVPFFLGSDTWNVYMTSWVFTEENRPGREALSNAMMAYVAQFARTGDPNEPGSDLLTWGPWSNDEGEWKCILFDAGYDATDIEMSTVELTQSGVLEAMKSEVSEPLYSEAFEYLSSFIMASYLLEED